MGRHLMSFMSVQPNRTALQSRIIKTEPTHWPSLKFLQQDNFKELPFAAKEKLKTSLLSNNFSHPFYVWEYPNTKFIYCLDDQYWHLVLEQLIAEGYDVNEYLPATCISCASIKEAAGLVF